MKEKKARVEDAMHATRAANQEGILLRRRRGSAACVGWPEAQGLSHDEEVGYNIVVRGLALPDSADFRKTPARMAPSS